jgi:hypothetical protein
MLQAMGRTPLLRDMSLVNAPSASLCLGLVAIFGAPDEAFACTCPSAGAATVWPEDGATGIPLDTPLVLYRFESSGRTDVFSYALTVENGDDVPLTVTHTLAPAFQGCGVGTFETTFLRPAQPLEPETVYTLQVGDDPRFHASFTTGDGTFTPEPMVGELQYLLVREPNCIGSNCASLAEAHMELGVRPETPRWFVVESAAAKDNRNAAMFWPEDDRMGTSGQLSVALPEHDPCIDVRVYGIEGTPLFEEHRCEPDRCVQYALWGGSTCGDPPHSGVDAARIADGTCEDPPILRRKEGEGIVYPDGRTYPDDATDAGTDWSRAASSGCSVGRGRLGVVASLSLLLVVAWLRQRSRERFLRHCPGQG